MAMPTVFRRSDGYGSFRQRQQPTPTNLFLLSILLLLLLLLASTTTPVSAQVTPHQSGDALYPRTRPETPHCFTSTPELLDAIDQYLRLLVDAHGPGIVQERQAVAQSYGWPMNEWCVSQLTDFSFLFEDLPNFAEDLSQWDVSRATTLEGMFRDASVFNSNIARWDVSRVQTFSFLFAGSPSFNQDLSGWNVEGGTEFQYMFYRDFRLAQYPLTSWNLVRATSLKGMFHDACTIHDLLQARGDDLGELEHRRIQNSHAHDILTDDLFAKTTNEDGLSYFCPGTSLGTTATTTAKSPPIQKNTPDKPCDPQTDRYCEHEIPAQPHRRGLA